MATLATGPDVKTPEVTFSYTPDLFELRERENGSKGYGVTLIIPKITNKAVLDEAAFAVAKEAWPGKPVADWIKDGTIKSPFLDGDGPQGKYKEGERKGEQRPELKGCWFIRCTSGEKYKPKVFDRRRNPIYDVAECPSGSRGFAVINPYAWNDKRSGDGLSFGISIVQVAHKAVGDEVLGGGGGADPNKFLEVLDDEGEAPASTKSGAGAGGLFG